MLLDLMLSLNPYARWSRGQDSAGNAHERSEQARGQSVRYARLVGPLLGLWVGAVAGCSDSTDRPEAGDLQYLIATHCEQADACNCAAGNVSTSCNDDLTDRWNTRVRQGEQRGLTYDAECFASLTSDVEAYGCGWISGSAQLCTRFCAVYHGELAAGAACDAVDSLVSDCAQGLVCHDGTCTEPCAAIGGRAEGEPCVDNNLGIGPYDDCAAGLTCDYSSGVCEALAAEGESCSFSECGAGLTCDHNGGSICRVAPGEGEACDGQGCAEGLDCQWTETKERICVAYAQAGQSCEQRRCFGDLICDEFNICRELPVSGERCLYSQCAQPALCDFESDVCRERPVEGEQCFRGECDTGLWCQSSADDPDGTCTLPLANDEMCSGHRQCESGYCPNGFCWPARGLGDTCSMQDGFCGSGLVCNGETCEAALGQGPAVCTYPGW